MNAKLGLAALALAIGAVIVAVVVGGMAVCADTPIVPDLQIDAPESLAPQARRLQRVDRTRLVAVARLVGLESSGPPIRVVLAAEDSPLARETPTSVTAFATGDLIVVFPGRAPSYPHETLEEVLQHEVAHVLITRAAGRRRVPRWFHEGVARVAERTWSLGERTRLVYSLASGGAVSPQQLDTLFHGDPTAVARAYSVSSAFVDHLLERHGPGLPARVLRAMRAGREFEAAFLVTTGQSVTDANAEFWGAERFWLAWFPWLTSAEAVYALITVLALTAIWRIRARRAERERANDHEDARNETDVRVEAEDAEER